MLHGRMLHFTQSEWFNICAEHAKQMSDPGMEIWECEPIRPTSPEARNAEASKALVPAEGLLRRGVSSYYSAGVGQSRDSDCLEQSNFAVMLARTRRRERDRDRGPRKPLGSWLGRVDCDP